MYQIDGNTFIDDSLVTCAEYQLFIDEMRAQGQFFQPDHWTHCQFPVGQARAPILGVRASDAKAFCEWLSRREAGEWHFRLPNSDEAAGYPIETSNGPPSGFWTLDRKDYQFAWVDPAPADARGIDFSSFFAVDRDLAFARDMAFAREVDRALDLARARALARDLDRALTIDRDLAFARELALDLVRDLARALSRALDLDLERDLNRARNRPLDLDRNRILARDLALDLDIDRDLARDIDRAFGVDLALARDLTRDLERDLDLVLFIWIDLITLQERLAGRAPAFEGIRLVKERVG
jgi:hypothetical protein